MEPDRRNRITDLYHAALQLAPEERAAFMNAACDGDEALRQEVESLLSSDERAKGFVRHLCYWHLPPLLVRLKRTPPSYTTRSIG